ncbi:MAG: hypothetical protein R6V50_07335 [Thermoplasmatota archaeon]
MGEINKNKLYEDAIYWHLIGEGYSDFIAKEKAKKMAEKNDLL